MRIEAENFRRLEGFAVEDRNDHGPRTDLMSSSPDAAGRIRTPFDEPFTSDAGRYDVDIRCSANGRRQPASAFWSTALAAGGGGSSTSTTASGPRTQSPMCPSGAAMNWSWKSRPNAKATVRLDYVQLNLVKEG